MGVVADFLYVDDLGSGGHQIDLVFEIPVSEPDPKRGAGMLGLGAAAVGRQGERRRCWAERRREEDRGLEARGGHGRPLAYSILV
jgi:hypothetical protein